MRIPAKIICIASALLLTACADTTPKNVSENAAGGIFSETKAPTETAAETEEVGAAVPESVPPTEERARYTAEREKPEFFTHDLIQIDMNYDGAPEELFLLDGGYEMVLYDPYNGMDYHSFTIPRTDKIDIYRRNGASEQPDYWFTCIYGENKRIGFNLTFTGNKTSKGIGGTGFGQELAPYVSYNEYNVSMLDNDFEALINDPLKFFNERGDYGGQFEFAETINLDELANADCVKSFLYELELPNGLEAIDVFGLENDAFGMEKMLSNSKYTVYLSDFDGAELYERDATMQVPTEVYHKYDLVPRGELDYLLCFKSDGGAECVYLGTVGERYLFPYNFSANDGFTEITAEELQKDGWVLCGDVEPPF